MTQQQELEKLSAIEAAAILCMSRELSEERMRDWHLAEKKREDGE